MARIAEVFAFAFAAATAAGCASSPRACSSASACGGGVCHTGRCGALDEVPIALATRRVVLSAIALRSSESARYVATFGGATTSPTLLVRFAPAWGKGRVERAFLVLTPAPGARASAAETTLTIARALEPWTPSSPEPRVGPIEARATVSFAPPRVVRIDVTDGVREWSRTGDRHHGFVVRASSDDSVGVAIAIGAEEAPRLDVYVADEAR